MKRLPVISVKKDDKYVNLVPYLATAFISNKYLKYVEIDDDTINKSEEIINLYNKNTIHKHPDRLFLITTTECDGRCVYCYDSNYRQEKKYLTIEEIKSVIESRNITTIKDVIIYGGEPFLDPERTFDIIHYIQEDLKCNNVHVVTSLFFDENTFIKILGFCQARNITLTISMDPPSYNNVYPRVYPNVKNIYEFLLDRINVLLNTTDIIFGVRATISNYSYDGVKLFKDLNSLSENKPVSINFDLIKGYPIDKDKLEYFLITWSKFAPEVIKTLLGRTYGTIFHPTFNSLIKKYPLISIMKNCDAGRGRISILPGGKTSLCNEDVNGDNNFEINYDNIFPFTEKCDNCGFKYSCGYHCFTIDKKYMDNYCIFHKYLFMESFKNFVRITPIDEIEEWINKQLIQGFVD